MHFSEDDLRAALRRKNPSPDFMQRVLANVGRSEAREEPRGTHSAIFSLRRWPAALRWAACAAVACVLAAVLLVYHRREQQIEAAKAREQALLALRITDAKLNLVLRHSVLERGVLPQILETGPKLQKEHL